MTTKREAYKAFCGDLCRNFDKPWDQVGAKLDFAFEFLGHIPADAWRPMVAIAMRTWEKWPANWAKAVGLLYQSMPRARETIAYDAVEDLRFPIGLMQRAFEILLERGYGPYRAYADAVGMPAKDRDRVEFKAQICRGSVDVPKLQTVSF